MKARRIAKQTPAFAAWLGKQKRPFFLKRKAAYAVSFTGLSVSFGPFLYKEKDAPYCLKPLPCTSLALEINRNASGSAALMAESVRENSLRCATSISIFFLRRV